MPEERKHEPEEVPAKTPESRALDIRAQMKAAREAISHGAPRALTEFRSFAPRRERRRDS